MNTTIEAETGKHNWRGIMRKPKTDTEWSSRMTTLKYVTLLLLPFLCISCISNDYRHAKRSLQGTWRVTSVFSDENDTSGPNRDGQHKEAGQLGSFTFSENDVTYSYTRLGKTYSGTSPWKLTREKVPQSFVSVERYTLYLKDQSYHVSFGDRTSDAERNAREITLKLIPVANEDRYHIIELIKK